MSPPITRPIFFYNSPQRVGAPLSLHLFEPRYRLMISRIVHSHKEFVYVAHGRYGCQIGDVGLICTIGTWQILPDGRAVISGLFTQSIIITSHWVEENSGELAYCQGIAPLPSPTLDELVLRGPVDAEFARVLSTYSRSKAFALERDVQGEYVAVEVRSRVYATLPVVTDRGHLEASAEPIGYVDVGQAVSGLELVVPNNDDRYASGALFAHIRAPVEGFVLFSTLRASLWRPRNPLRLPGVKVVACPLALCLLLCNGTPAAIDAAAKAICSVDPNVRLVLCPTLVRSVPLPWVCERILSMVAPGTSLRTFLDGLAVHTAFNQVVANARITHAPDMLPRLRKEELLDEWRAIYQEDELPPQDSLDALSPRIPFFVSITCEGSTFNAPGTVVTLVLGTAFAKLREIAVSIFWPAVRLVLISHLKEEGTFFHSLPLEVVLLIASYVAPEMFRRGLSD